MARLFVEVSKNVCFVIQSTTFTLIRVWLGIHLFLSMQHNKIIVIGGGFFGLYLSRFLNQIGYNVKVIEAEAEPMQHASYNNQARVHQGYHYPRSVLTALRSRETFSKFILEFPECIYRDFTKYYLIGKPLGKVSSSQFYSFFKRLCSE